MEEFQNQTDPRTADTDGDGFDDAFEVANGMDPIVQADFTPVEPDENQNGIIDLWENAPYLYGFTDTNHNGFDDIYEEYCLEPASEGNYDVVVDVYTTRSAALTWTTTNATQGFVLAATAGTAVRLRLPFGEDTQIALLPAPEGDDPPAGELWKSRLRLSFAPRDGQTAVGTCVVSADDEIQQKVVVAESTMSRFPDPPANLSQGLVQAQSLRGDTAGDVPRIEIAYRKLGIKPVDPGWHFVDELIGPFSITNYAGALPADVSWSVDYGEVSVAPGSVVVYLRVTEEPPSYKNGVITLKAASELDAETVVTNRIEVPKCIQPEFSLTDGTGNFSPHLGETASFTLALPGCNHATREGWIEGELMRETTAGWQHVGWLDASQAQPGHQKRRRCLFGPQTITWDGIATESAALADSPDVFTEGSAPFHRALPAVVSGEPVPPPYYTLFFRYREADSDTADIVAEARTTVSVPQVVNVEMTDLAYNEFCLPIVYPDTYWPELIGNPELNGGVSVELYSGSSMLHYELLSNIAQVAQSAMPVGVNIRFSTSSVPIGVKTVTIKHRDIDTNVRLLCWGTTPSENVSWRNTTPSGDCEAYIDRIRFDPCNEKFCVEWADVPPYLYATNLFPYSETDLTKAVAYTCVHEVGHTLGLVHPTLYGIAGYHNWAPLDWKGSRVQAETNWFMNPSEPSVFRYDKAQGKPREWFWLNAKYMIFILPSPNGDP